MPTISERSTTAFDGSLNLPSDDRSYHQEEIFSIFILKIIVLFRELVSRHLPVQIVPMPGRVPLAAKRAAREDYWKGSYQPWRWAEGSGEGSEWMI